MNIDPSEAEKWERLLSKSGLAMNRGRSWRKVTYMPDATPKRAVDPLDYAPPLYTQPAKHPSGGPLYRGRPKMSATKKRRSLEQANHFLSLGKAKRMWTNPAAMARYYRYRAEGKCGHCSRKSEVGKKCAVCRQRTRECTARKRAKGKSQKNR